MLEALIHYNFLQHAFLGAILASIACGIIGTIIIEKKLVMMTGGIAHASFGGIGLGYLLNFTPILGALIFSLIASLGISVIESKIKTNTDILIGMFWSLGMALGIIFISFTPGYPPDMTSYLFGDILTISGLDLILIGVLDLIIIFILISLFDYLKAFLFDEEFLKVLGINTKLINYLIYILIAFTVVILIRLVGIILILALLTTPPAIAKQFTYDFKKTILLSIGFGISFCLLGLWISYELNIASGAAIIIIAVLSYLIITFSKSTFLSITGKSINHKKSL
ncbi:zinc transport system permease protein [Desulfonispora thiosulfatigenes DSM 11270]|uniref:Zinc transport system permease protein n=1 Tax=Desulfonispora thiosulfatigenes DSM 11270 TaxID=656914 RepID=A0A1W1VT75_DESTI|nr:metal ABC transporter permease [Desulfonispora thiosulfatigenes]SMB96558.1 zinc transport system permease protein [Desulfonispora thiosulfatigenes DSM 11270]